MMRLDSFDGGCRGVCTVFEIMHHSLNSHFPSLLGIDHAKALKSSPPSSSPAKIAAHCPCATLTFIFAAKLPTLPAQHSPGVGVVGSSPILGGNTFGVMTSLGSGTAIVPVRASSAPPRSFVSQGAASGLGVHDSGSTAM